MRSAAAKLFLLILALPGFAHAADPGCPVLLFKPGISVGQAARHCSTEGGLLVRHGSKWDCQDRQFHATIFSFAVTAYQVVGPVTFYPQASARLAAGSPGRAGDCCTLNAVLDFIAAKMGFEPTATLEDPSTDPASTGLSFRWVLPDGSETTVQELNRPYVSLVIRVTGGN